MAGSITARIKNGKFYYDIYNNSYRKKIYTGLDCTKPASKEIVAATLKKVSKALEGGYYKEEDYFSKTKNKVQDKTTLQGFSEVWLDSLSHQSKTMKNYQSSMNTLNKAFGAKELRDITALDLQKWIKNCGLEPKSIRNYLGVLSKLYKQAIIAKIVLTSPVPDLTLPMKKSEEETIDPFEDEKEVFAILDYFRNKNIKIHNWILFAFETGLRPSESICLENQDIDLKTCKVKVHRAYVDGIYKPTKNYKTRYVSLTDAAIAAIRGQSNIPFDERNKTDKIFLNPYTGNMFDTDHFRSGLWYDCLDALKIRRHVLYATRHTFGSKLVSEGYPMKYVSIEMGHKDTSVTERHYGKYSEKAKDEMLVLRNAKKSPLLKLVGT